MDPAGSRFHTHTVPHICVGEGPRNQPSGFEVSALPGLQAKAPQINLPPRLQKGLHLPWWEGCQSQTRPAPAVQRTVHSGSMACCPFSGQEPGRWGERGEVGGFVRQLMATNRT